VNGPSGIPTSVLGVGVTIDVVNGPSGIPTSVLGVGVTIDDVDDSVLVDGVTVDADGVTVGVDGVTVDDVWVIGDGDGVVVGVTVDGDGVTVGVDGVTVDDVWVIGDGDGVVVGVTVDADGVTVDDVGIMVSSNMAAKAVLSVKDKANMIKVRCRFFSLLEKGIVTSQLSLPIFAGLNPVKYTLSPESIPTCEATPKGLVHRVTIFVEGTNLPIFVGAELQK